MLLALTETVSALVAPSRAPSDEDWAAAAAVVRAGFAKGDLIVATPAWADQVMRLHLGDLVTVGMAARLDGAKYGRVWELSQRGASALESGDGRPLRESRHGGLRLRLHERHAASVTYDFFQSWRLARVVRVEAGNREVMCDRLPERFQCPGIVWNEARPFVMEMGETLHRAFYVHPVRGATMVVEYPAVPMGRELAVGSGLHHAWYRRAATGTVKLRVLVDGKPVGEDLATNRSGFSVRRFDTAAFAGKSATVRFEITSDNPDHRRFGFAAEARDP